VTEPHEVAPAVEEVVPGVLHWHLRDDRIGGFISAAHAVTTDDGTILIDPLPLAPEALAGLGAVSAVCLTSGGHQRSAWRLRHELGAPVHAPALSQTLEEEPDARYGDGDRLPGGLRAIFTPGAGTTQHTFLLDGDPDIAFVSDLLVHEPETPLEVIPAEYAHDIDEARRSVERLLDLPFSVLCLGHGTPITGDPKTAIRAALAS
jgi:glyoxylase-like metal-dependent hydrolase (beta-lactamase superfamily II)